jgi:hypothetical protein
MLLTRMAGPFLDDSTWPLVVVTFNDSMSNDDVGGYFERLRSYLKRRERFAVVLDARRVRMVDAVRRKMHGDFLASIDGPDRFVAAAALVVEEEVQRGLLTAIFWIHKPKFPIERFEGLGEAMLWARDRIREREETARRSGFPSQPPPRMPSVSSMRVAAAVPASPGSPGSSSMRSVPPVPFVPSNSPAATSIPPPPLSATRISSAPPPPSTLSGTRASTPPPPLSAGRISSAPPGRDKR